MSLSEAITGALIRALAQDIEADGVRGPQDTADWILQEGKEGIARRIEAFFRSDTFSSALDDVDMQVGVFIDYANTGSLQGVRAGLEVGLSPDTADEKHGRTVLMRCAQSGSPAAVQCIRALLDAGADVHRRARDGITVFHVACEEAREAELLELLEAQSATSALMSAMDALLSPRPPRERCRAAGCHLQESPWVHDAEARLWRANVALRVGRYASGLLPRTHCEGEGLPACYRRAWTPDSHRFFPPPFRRAAELLLLHSRRPLGAESDGCGGSLPATIWRQIFGFMSRDWVMERPAGGAGCPNCGHGGASRPPGAAAFCCQCGQGGPVPGRGQDSEDADMLLSF